MARRPPRSQCVAPELGRLGEVGTQPSLGWPVARVSGTAWGQDHRVACPSPPSPEKGSPSRPSLLSRVMGLHVVGRRGRDVRSRKAAAWPSAALTGVVTSQLAVGRLPGGRRGQASTPKVPSPEQEDGGLGAAGGTRPSCRFLVASRWLVLPWPGEATPARTVASPALTPWLRSPRCKLYSGSADCTIIVSGAAAGGWEGPGPHRLPGAPGPPRHHDPRLPVVLPARCGTSRTCRR